MEKNSQASVRDSTLNESQDWVYFREIDSIPDNLLGLNISTLDFKVRMRFTVGELPEDRAFHELIRNPKLINKDFVIKKNEIIPFITSLEESTGGKGTFRYLTVSTSTIRSDGWRLKFLNLYMNPKGEGFIVCDRYSRAIRWKDIVPYIDMNRLGWYNSKEQ